MNTTMNDPLLASIENISHTSSTIFAVVDAFFFLAMVVKVFKAKTHRFALILLTVLALGVFPLGRADVSPNVHLCLARQVVQTLA